METMQNTESMREKNGYKIVMLITESRSKIYKPKLYNEIIHNLIHRRHWPKAIEEELQNLENYLT